MLAARARASRTRRRMRKSPWRPTPARSSAAVSPSTAPPASRASRSARRASMRATSRSSAASTRRRRRAAPPRSCTPRGSPISTSTSCTRCRARTSPARCATSRQALALAPAHLSHYQLTLEPGTRVRGAPAAAARRRCRGAHARRVRRAARAAGLRAVRGVGVRARPGAQCRHNLNYWNFGDYLGVGAGAHGKLTLRRARRDRAHHAAARAAPLSGGAGRQRSRARCPRASCRSSSC